MLTPEISSITPVQSSIFILKQSCLDVIRQVQEQHMVLRAYDHADHVASFILLKMRNQAKCVINVIVHTLYRWTP